MTLFKLLYKNFLVSHYEDCRKYYKRCEVYYCHDGVFCPCCGMALRTSPTSKGDKERLKQLQLRREEQDRIIMIIKRIKKYSVNQGKSESSGTFRIPFFDFPRRSIERTIRNIHRYDICR